MARVAALSTFTEVAAQPRTHILNNYNNLPTAAARGVMREMVNHDLHLWVHKLVRFAHQARPEVVLPPPGTVFDMPPVPTFLARTLAFCRGGGVALKLTVDVAHSQRITGNGTNKRKAGVANIGPSSSPGTGTSPKRAPMSGVHVAQLHFVHDSPPAAYQGDLSRRPPRWSWR